jgi:signal transduction histidine kinase
MDAGVSERRSVARDVHDGVAQELAFIASRAQGLDCTGRDAMIVAQIRAAALRALMEARLAIEGLRAADDLPLGVLLERALACVQARAAVEVTLEVADDIAVDAERRTALLRILSQAIANATEHGAARHVAVRLCARDGGLSLRIADDGCGFDVASAATARGWGLVGMEERAGALGGTFRVVSRPGHGATVEVMLP